METIVQCRACGEDANRADWEASRGCCAHCGEPADHRFRYGWERLASLRSRLELEQIWRPGVCHA